MATQRRRGVKIYKAKDAPPLHDTDFMYPGSTSAETGTALAGVMMSNAAESGQLRVLVRQSEEEGGFSLVHVWFKPNFPLPRHSHNADCMYYVISGQVSMGSQVLEAGDSFFVPEGAPYLYSAGPDGVEVLEIRRGTPRFDIALQDASPEQWESMGRTYADNQELWASLDAPPSFAGRHSE